MLGAVTGPLYFSYAAFKMQPRDDLDILINPAEIKIEDIINFYDKGLLDDTLYGINPGGHDGMIRERWFARALDTI